MNPTCPWWIAEGATGWLHASSIARSIISLGVAFRPHQLLVDPKNKSAIKSHANSAVPVDTLQGLQTCRSDESDARVVARKLRFDGAERNAVVSHYNIMPVIDIFGTVQGRDLGGVSRKLRAYR